MPGSGPTGHTEVPRERPGTGSAGRPEGLRDPGIPDRRRVQVPRRGRGGSAGRPGPRDGRKERKGVRQVRPRTGGPHPPASQSPSGKGVRAAGPRRRPRAKAASAHRLPPPSPSQPGAQGPGEAGEGPVRRQPPQGAQTRRRCAPPSSPFPSTRPSPRTPQEGGTGTNPRRPAGGRRARPARRPPPSPNPGRGAGWGTRPRGQRGPGSGPAERKEGEGTPGSRRGPRDQPQQPTLVSSPSPFGGGGGAGERGARRAHLLAALLLIRNCSPPTWLRGWLRATLECSPLSCPPN